MAYLLRVMGYLGDAVIRNLIDKIGDKMNKFWSKGGGGGECGVKDALKDLKISLMQIQPTITKVENMWIKDWDLRDNVDQLLVQLKDAAYDAEDLLDNFQFQKLQKEIMPQGNEASDTSLRHPTKKRKVEEDTGHDDVITEIRKIQKKFDNIQIDIGKLLGSDDRENIKKITEIDRMTTSTPVETQVLGRGNELKELMRLLLEPDESPSGSESSYNIPVLIITGMGGVGKTTLAQQAYNDKAVQEYFKLKIWICVSEHFSEERLTKEIIASITKKKCPDLQNSDALQVVLKENIASKKFLLILDDVWNEDKHKWDKFCALLRSGSTGSKILVTTRNVQIANMVGSVNPIHLNVLDENSCWAVLKKCAFGLENSGDYPQLEAIAREMVPKLKGLPLAARTLGGLLNKNKNEEHWRAIMDSEIWKLPQEEHGVLLVLQLSYWYLPAHLKRCFAFCSLYPKDYEFEKHEMVRIWMAEGFFSAQKNITMENFGSVCFQELVSRSFFQKSQRSSRYVMHDLIHDLAQLISGRETHRIEDGKLISGREAYRLLDGKPFEIPTMLRRLNIINTKLDMELRRLECYDLSKLRTLIYRRHKRTLNLFLTCGFFSRLQRIRTLILEDCGLRELPESIGDFKHLRYLDVSGNSITKLPNSLCKLYNLQALILNSCYLNELPDNIGNLFNLRHLDISSNKDLNKLPESLCHLSNLKTLKLVNCDGLQSLPQGTSRLINLRELDAFHPVEITEVGKLTSLQNLSIFKVGKEHGQKLAELSGLTQLHGTLTIMNLENVESKEEAITAKLHSKEHLDDLVLEWTKSDDAFSDADTEEEVLEHLRPNPTVKRLTIKGYNGARSPSWLEAGSLLKLKSLYLKDCRRWDNLSFIRQELFGSTKCNWFPCLSFLHIYNCPLLKSLPLPTSLTRLVLNNVGLTEFSGIQEGMGGSRSTIATVSPLVVQISKCPNLTSLDTIGCFPCIKSLDIADCPLLTKLPPLPPSLVKLKLIKVGLKKLPKIGGSSSNIAIVSLLKMQISGCPNLTSLNTTGCFPCLNSLDIADCPLLTRLPPLPPSLVELKLIKLGLKGLPKISGSSSNIAIVSPLKMQISGCPNLTSLDTIECFPCLKYLDIADCLLLKKLPPLPPSLVELKLIKVGLIKLPGIGGSSSNITPVSLSRLHIEECSSMISLEQGLLSCNLPKLATILIKNCGELQRMPVEKFKEFNFLSSLSIVNCPKLMSMAQDDDIHPLLPPSIQTLHLSNCGEVETLLTSCLHNLTNLTKLELDNCPLSREALLELGRLKSLHLLNWKWLRSKAIKEDT